MRNRNDYYERALFPGILEVYQLSLEMAILSGIDVDFLKRLALCNLCTAGFRLSLGTNLLHDRSFRLPYGRGSHS